MSRMQPTRDISVTELAALRQRGESPRLIDVREPCEFQRASIADAELMPLGAIQEWVDTLDREQPYIIMCHHGSRSEMVCSFLRSRGFKQAINLDGGIDAWSLSVDPNVARY